VVAVQGFSRETADCSPQRRARMAKAICDLALEQNLEASGALTTESTEIAVANSHGLFVQDRSTRANLMSVIMGEDGAGYAERTSRDVGDLDAEAVGREAIDKAIRSRGATAVEPGEYVVVLEEYAVGDLLTYSSYMGFGALAYQEGHSFLRGKLGQRVVDERISIWDDGHDRRGLPMAFDYEGVPKRRVDIIADGVATGVVHDSQTAARDGVASTGHGLPAPNTFGPFASHLVMAAGDVDKKDLAKGIERGLWVTRFHYVNVLQPDRAVLTGMTRDGTFLIERGEVTSPVKNLRFTQSTLEAWSSLGALGRELMLVDSWGGGVLVPAMRLDRFTFTGVSQEESV
jgi:PmbA protein